MDNIYREYLLFSSVGNSYDKALEQRYSDNRNYDIFNVYYCHNSTRYKYISKFSDKCVKLQGSKFKNFVRCFKEYDFSKYKYIWIVDDDIEMECNDINTFFELSKKYDVHIAGPSRCPTGFNTSYYNDYMIQKENCIFRKSPNIEIGVMLFNINILKMLLTIIEKPLLEDKLFCRGIDLMCTEIFSHNCDNFYNFDIVKCRNPYSKEKKMTPSYREYEIYASHIELVKGWNNLRQLLEQDIINLRNEYKEIYSL